MAKLDTVLLYKIRTAKLGRKSIAAFFRANSDRKCQSMARSTLR